MNSKVLMARRAMVKNTEPLLFLHLDASTTSLFSDLGGNSRASDGANVVLWKSETGFNNFNNTTGDYMTFQSTPRPGVLNTGVNQDMLESEYANSFNTDVHKQQTFFIVFEVTNTLQQYDTMWHYGSDWNWNDGVGVTFIPGDNHMRIWVGDYDINYVNLPIPSLNTLTILSFRYNIETGIMDAKHGSFGGNSTITNYVSPSFGTKALLGASRDITGNSSAFAAPIKFYEIKGFNSYLSSYSYSNNRVSLITKYS